MLLPSLGFLLFLLFAFAPQRSGEAVEVFRLENALQLVGFRLEDVRKVTGAYPPTLAELLKIEKAWGDRESPTEDPWGNTFEYRVVDGAVEISSLGADGEPGGDGADADRSWTVRGGLR